MTLLLPSRARAFALAGTALAGLVLAGCDGGADVRSNLGLLRNAPDEFSVVTQAPLVLPPDYTLRPPQPGAQPTQQANPERAASEAVFGASLATGPAAGAPVGTGAALAPSSLEQQLLSQAGAANADPDIRATLNRESGAIAEKSTTFAQSVLGIQVDPSAIVVDAPAEAARLRGNASQGLPATTGDTPQINRGNPGLLEGVF